MVEREGAFDVGDLQVHVADVYPRIDGLVHDEVGGVIRSQTGVRPQSDPGLTPVYQPRLRTILAVVTTCPACR